MSQPEINPHSRSAIISELACVVGEISNIQVEQARQCERTAALQARLGRLIRDLATTAALTTIVSALSDVVREAVWAGLAEYDRQDQARRPAPAAQAAPSEASPSAQDEARPVKVGKALDAPPDGEGRGIAPGESRECRHDAGAGGASAASADTAPAADEEPRVPRRPPAVKTEGGGLVQDGGSRKPAPTQKDSFLNLYAATPHSPAEICQRAGLNSSSASVYLSIARKEGDPRVIKGDATRSADRSKRALDAYALGVKTLAQIDTALGLRAGTTSNFVDQGRAAGDPRVQKGDALRGQRAAEPAPAKTVEPPAPAPAPPPPSTVIAQGEAEKTAPPALAPDHAIVVEALKGKIHGPAGVWETSARVAKTLAVLADGRLFGLNLLMQAGKWDKESEIFMLLPEWTAALEKIGVRLVHTKGIGVKLNRVEAA